jgi:hypothetical protein
MANDPLQVHVVAHTHWDREWYHAADRFRQRLVPLVDELLDAPPRPGESFLLDGQAIVLEDYLAVRPERAAELSVLLRDGRLEAGPWYVLADELIPSGEALVRNLLAGRRAMRRLRGEAPPVLYCPDSFGHPAILPELAAGFGCQLIVLWRGFGGSRWLVGDVALWRGPSGATVPVYALPPDGYEFGSSLPVDDGEARARWEGIRAVLEPRAATGVALLLNGADHHARQRAQADAVRALARAATPALVVASSLRGAAAAIVARVANGVVPTVEGELRDSYGSAWTLQGTLGVRAAQKRLNAQAERRLVRDVEPWLALLPAGGEAATRAQLDAAWRTLLQSHPHDTLCGTSIDTVALAMDARLRSVETQARGLREDALLALAGHDREQVRALLDDSRPVVLLRNPAPRTRSGVVELRLSATVAAVAVGPHSGTRQGTPRQLPRWGVEGMPLQILSRRERVALTEAPRAYPRADRVGEVRALGWVDDLGGYAMETRAQRKRRAATMPDPVRADGLTLENGLLRVMVDPGGEVLLEDLATGRVIHRLLSLEQRVEAGDLYTPAPREALAAPTLLNVRATLRGPLRGEIALSHTLGDDRRGRGRCVVRLQLDAALPALRVLLEGRNRDGNHRLRLRVATDLAHATTLADSAFLPVGRAPLDLPDSDQRTERVVPTAPLHEWVTRFGGDAGVTLFSDGLTEYESLEDGSIAVTLFRAVGELSRADLPERPGHAGWPAKTPGAQAIGPYAANFAVALHGADHWRTRELIARLADDVLLPIRGETLRYNLLEAHVAGGLELRGEGLVFSTACPAQADGWIVLRCVNRRDEPTRGEWRLGRRIEHAVRARLDETPGAALQVRDGSIEFDAAPHEVVTILVR